MSRANPEGARPWLGIKPPAADAVRVRDGESPLGTSPVLFSENFQDYDLSTSTSVLPGPEYVLHNVDNRTPASPVAYVNAAWVVREDFSFSPGTPRSCEVLDCAAFSTSWYTPAGAANDWIVLPAVVPAANTQLSWNAVTYDVDYRDGYEVRLSTTGTAVANFTTTLFSTAAENSTWTARNLSLAAFAGQNVHIAFRNNSTDKFLLLIDDIVIQNVFDVDPALQSIDYTSEYTRVPAFFGMTFPLSASVRNAGTQALTQVTVEADVLVDGTIAEAYTSAPPLNLAPGATATAPLGTLTVDTIGEYTAEGTVDAAEGDEYLANSSVTDDLLLGTSGEMARDDGVMNGTLGIGAGNGGELGQQFAIPAPARLAGVWFTLNVTDEDPDAEGPALPDGVPEYAGRTVTINLREFDTANSTPGALIAQGTVEVPEDVELGEQAFVAEFPPGTLVPEEFVVTLVEDAPTPEFPAITATLGLSDTRFTAGTTWVNWPTSPLGGWGNNEDFGANFAKSYMLRPLLEEAAFSPTAVDDDFIAPANGVLEDSVATNDTLSDLGGNTFALVDDVATGTLVFNADGSFSYTPDADSVATDGFTYSLCDAETNCSQATVTIEVNDVPQAADDSFDVSGSLSDSVAGNDTPSLDGGNVWAVATDAVNGDLVLNADGSFTYTPDAGYEGTDSFDYTLCDTDGDCDTATVSLMVTAVPIQAEDDSFVLTQDTVFDGSVAGNDTASSPADIWSLVTGPTQGTVDFNADGSFTYTPNAGFSGSDGFTYQICDAGNTCDSANVTLTVRGLLIFADGFETP